MYGIEYIDLNIPIGASLFRQCPAMSCVSQARNYASCVHGDASAVRRAEPEDMVGPTLFLLSDASSFITSHCLIVDGGWLPFVGPVDKYVTADG
jgi:NAD(P)-dependent dehydrogenase (short-subunit alcohol dehydrogenase family)